MCGINAVGAQGSVCMFTLCHAPLEMAVLLHKTEKVCRVMNTAVVIQIKTAFNRNLTPEIFTPVTN